MRDQRTTRVSTALPRPSPAAGEGGASARGRWARLLLLVAILGAASLAAIPFRAYVAATALGIVPGTVVYTYFADSLLAGVVGASRRACTSVLEPPLHPT